MAGSGSLHIRRHVVTYRCVDQDAGTLATGSLDEALDEGLTAHLDEALAAVGTFAAGGVWLIRRIDLSIAIGKTWSAQRIAGAMARCVAVEVARTVSDGANGSSVIWFPDRATFVARYLGDVARGRAKRRWEYAEFASADGGAAAAILEVTRDSPGDVIDALRRFTVDDVDDVLRTLSRGDALAMLGLLASDVELALGDPLDAVISALVEVPGAARLGADLAALALFVHAVRNGAPASVSTAVRAEQVAQLAVAIARQSPERARHVAEAIIHGSWSELDAGLLADLAPIVSWPPDARTTAASAVLHSAHGGAANQPDEHRSVTTRLGGMFLLLPLLDEMPWSAATATWPPLDGVDAQSVARFVVMIAALGSDRNAIAASDPLLRMTCGIPTSLTAAAVSAWLGALPEPAIRAFESAMVAQLTAHGRASGHMVLATTDVGIVAVDSKRGVLIAVAADDPESLRDLAARLADTFGRPITLDAVETWIEACLDPDSRSGRIDDHIDPIEAVRLADLREQTAWTRLGPPFELPPRIGSIMLTTAQALLRDLAWRLPGLAHSSLPYLWQNVLACSASVDFETDRVVATLSRAPMHMLLSLTGMNRRLLMFPATGARPWILTQT